MNYVHIHYFAVTKLAITSVMIIIVGASLSEQHTFCHCRICHAQVDIKVPHMISQQPGELLSVCLHIHELSFTIKSYTAFLTL